MGTLNKKGNAATFATQLIAGTGKHLAKTTQVAMMGSSFTPDQITSKLQSLVDLRSEVDAAKATTRTKVANETAGAPALRTFMLAYASFVKTAYSTSPDVLADFGIHPKTRAPQTVEQKAAAAAKRKATRAARHTMGAQQKKGIKGAVEGIVVTPILAAQPTVAPASPTAPAPSAGPTASTPTAPAPSAGPTGTAPHTA